MNTRLLVLAAVLLLTAGAAAAATVPETAYSDLHWRLVGPHRGGWATAVAGVPGDSATFYFGAADGGVWKTTDAGTTWRPLFDRYGSASIGALAVAPSDPRVLWAGTGQVHQRWDIVSGDGVYRSADGGASWRHVGLADSRHIGDLWVDPRDADTALVAALGPRDGGSTWTDVTPPATEEVYFADLWRGEPSLPASGPGHHRFVWDLRMPPPPTLRASYSIAAVPGRPTEVTPRGAFVLPGRYEVRLTTGGATVTRPLEVMMDPRVVVGEGELEALLDFQRQVEAALARAVALSREPEARALTSLATDLESADAAPTEPQREVLAWAIEQLDGG